MVTKKLNNKKDIIAFLQTLPMNALLDVASDAILIANSRSPQKIVITEAQFKTFFKIRGINEKGEPENRGRNKKQ